MSFRGNAIMKKKLIYKLKSNIEDESIIQISPFVKSLFTGVKIPADLDYKKEYATYLAKKYQ